MCNEGSNKSYKERKVLKLDEILIVICYRSKSMINCVALATGFNVYFKEKTADGKL